MSNEELVAERIVVWIAGYSAKELARMFDVSERTAKGWLSGNLPQNKHFFAMVERWGMGFLEDVVAPILSNRVDPKHRLERIETEARALRKIRPFMSIMLVTLSVAFQTLPGDDNPMVRAPKPTPARSRSDFVDDEGESEKVL